MNHISYSMADQMCSYYATTHFTGHVYPVKGLQIFDTVHMRLYPTVFPAITVNSKPVHLCSVGNKIPQQCGFLIYSVQGACV